jgi:hypothetical protein
MSFRAKREVLAQVAPRYREAGYKERCVILDEFVAVTGYARKYAIRVLREPVPPLASIRRPRATRYGAEVQAALAVAWAAVNQICGKRLVPFLPELVPTLERHGHLVVSEEVRTQLLTLSPATADRLLRPLRQRERGISTTKPGALLKHQIPVRTFSEWNDVRPGFLEADLVAHCGGVADGAFLYTLTLTDVATGWTECLPLLHRTQQAVVQALGHARRLLPFPLLGFDSDNGGEFLNAELLAYCAQEGIIFTRGRTANKNDQCFVEQKNGAVVRQVVGYDRFEGERAYRQLAELYRAVRLYVNFFQPSLKLRAKQRIGPRVRRQYDLAQTPFQRLVASDVLTAADQARLEQIYRALDPVRLRRQLETLQDALWRHAVFRTPVSPAGAAVSAAPTAVGFDVGACGLVSETAAHAGGPDPSRRGTPEPGARRKYRRTQKPPVPRWWRTRQDPFAAVRSEIEALLADRPERTAKSVLQELQVRYPGQYPAKQLRTLQHRVKEWRTRTLLAFDERWLSEELLVGQTLPGPLRARGDRLGAKPEAGDGSHGHVECPETVGALAAPGGLLR